MRTTFTLIAALLLTAGLQAQFRYLDATFDVGAPTVDTFGQNIDPFLLTLAQNGVPVNPNRHLAMDVYEPADDADTDLRPVVVFFHTGNFLPRFVNNGIYGTRKDSAVVEFCTQLASRGYVTIGAEYRQGWNPQAIDADVRTSTLLQAAYRGGQDAHMMARFLRKTVAEEGNPYGIDTTRIVYWGLGTGGYVSMTHAFLDSIPEILADDRFYDLNDVPYVNESVNADPQGLLFTEFAPMVPSNIPNHPTYKSGTAMNILTGGALGDLDWMEGKSTEPMIMGYHALRDQFAPFSFGDVIVPTTRELVIGGVGGSEQIVEKANMLGLNDAMASANSTDLSGIYGDLAEAVNVRNEELKMQTFDPDPDMITGFPEFELSHDNMYNFVKPDTFSIGYNWIDEAGLRASLAVYNMSPFLPARDADALIADEIADNPNAFNAAGARAAIDTMLAHFLPRAYVGLDLEGLVSAEDLVSNAAIGLEVFPNPAGAGFTVRTEAGHLIRTIRVLDLNGRVVTNITGVNSNNRFVNRGTLPRGTYILQLHLDEGTTARKLILN